jgi:hypothetical protein
MPIYSVTTEGEEALAAATVETLLQVRGVTGTECRIIAWGISFDSVTAADAPVVVDLLFQTTDGTGRAATVVPLDGAARAAVGTGFHSFSAEPTPGGIIESYNVPPQGGMVIREYPPGREPVVTNATSSRIGLRANSAAIVNVLAWIQWEE